MKAVFDAIFRQSLTELECALSTADIDCLDPEGRTPLTNAVIENALPLVEFLLSKGASVNHADSEGWTPLHFAAQDHLLDIAKLLIRAGAEVDAQDSNGATPLMRAIMNAYHGDEFIAFLKEVGANPHIKNAYDISAHDLETDSQ